MVTQPPVQYNNTITITMRPFLADCRMPALIVHRRPWGCIIQSTHHNIDITPSPHNITWWDDDFHPFKKSFCGFPTVITIATIHHQIRIQTSMVPRTIINPPSTIRHSHQPSAWPSSSRYWITGPIIYHAAPAATSWTAASSPYHPIAPRPRQQTAARPHAPNRCLGTLAQNAPIIFSRCKIGARSIFEDVSEVERLVAIESALARYKHAEDEEGTSSSFC